MATISFTPTFSKHGDFAIRAFNDNSQLSSRILVALQDPEARRSMSRVLRAKGFRAIELDEPFAAWSAVAEHASPRLSGFDFVVCGGFRTDREPDSSRAPRLGTRFFLLLGRRGFVPFAADGTPPPAWAFRRAGTGLVQDDPKGPASVAYIGRPPGARCAETTPGHTP
jgi:hypothetical protein